MSKQLRLELDRWRDFLKDVSIVVLGVVIALAADQYVKSRSDRSDAEAALRNIREELSYSIATALALAAVQLRRRKRLNSAP